MNEYEKFSWTLTKMAFVLTWFFVLGVIVCLFSGAITAGLEVALIWLVLFFAIRSILYYGCGIGKEYDEDN